MYFQKVIGKQIVTFVHTNSYLLADSFVLINFKLDVRKKFWIHDGIQWNLFNLGDSFKIKIRPLLKQKNLRKQNVDMVLQVKSIQI